MRIIYKASADQIGVSLHYRTILDIQLGSILPLDLVLLVEPVRVKLQNRSKLDQSKLRTGSRFEYWKTEPIQNRTGPIASLTTVSARRYRDAWTSAIRRSRPRGRLLMPLGRPLAVQLHPSTPQAGDAVVSRSPKLLERHLTRCSLQ